MTATPPVVVAQHPGETPNLNAALVEAQKTLEPVKKDAANPFFKSKYADLASVLDAILPALNAQGIALTQFARNDSEGVGCITQLRHRSGEMAESTFWLPVVKKDPQGYGSAFTYARRFGAKAAVGLAEEDDDGNSHAVDPKAKTAKDYTKPKPVPVDARGETPAKPNERQVAQTTGMPTTNWSDLGEPLTDRARLEVKMTECQTTEDLTLVASGIAPIAESGKLTPAETKELRSIYAQRMNALLIAAKK